MSLQRSYWFIWVLVKFIWKTTMVHQTVNIMTVTVGWLFNNTIILTVAEMRFPINKSKLYIISLCLSFLHLFLSALPWKEASWNLHHHREDHSLIKSLNAVHFFWHTPLVDQGPQHLCSSCYKTCFCKKQVKFDSSIVSTFTTGVHNKGEHCSFSAMDQCSNAEPGKSIWRMKGLVSKETMVEHKNLASRKVARVVAKGKYMPVERLGELA